MTKYKVPKLSTETPQDQQNRLLNAVKAVRGVESAQLYPGSSEVGITAQEKPKPKHSDIESAVSKAGFALLPGKI